MEENINVFSKWGCSRNIIVAFFLKSIFPKCIQVFLLFIFILHSTTLKVVLEDQVSEEWILSFMFILIRALNETWDKMWKFEDKLLFMLKNNEL